MNSRRISILLTALSTASLLVSGCSKKPASQSKATDTATAKTAETKASTKKAPAANDPVADICKKAFSVKCDEGFMGNSAAECESTFHKHLKESPKCITVLNAQLACMARGMEVFCHKEKNGKSVFSVKNGETLCKAEEKAVDACMKANHYDND